MKSAKRRQRRSVVVLLRTPSARVPPGRREVAVSVDRSVKPELVIMSRAKRRDFYANSELVRPDEIGVTGLCRAK